MSEDFEDLPNAVKAILERPKEKAFADLRDRVAYVYVTGCFPSHLRAEANELLRCATEGSFGLPALDRRGGPFNVLQPVAIRLDLDAHPMVAKVRQKIDEGFEIVASRGVNARRPFGKIFLRRGKGSQATEIAVKSDGSVLDHW